MKYLRIRSSMLQILIEKLIAEGEEGNSLSVEWYMD
jgi:hypothetical protein